MTFIGRVKQDATLFEKLHEMFRSTSFTVFAANELTKAWCVLEGCEFQPINEHEKEKIACSWASIPAADCVAHQMAFIARSRRMASADDPEALGENASAASSVSNTSSLVLTSSGSSGATANTQFLKSDNDFHTSEQDYMHALKHLTSASNLTKEQLYLSVNCAHLAYRSGLPFRDMTNSHYGPLRVGDL
jgi:hypothetical protein